MENIIDTIQMELLVAELGQLKFLIIIKMQDGQLLLFLEVC